MTTESLNTLLQKMIDEGLTFGAVINAFAARNSDYENALIERAREEHYREGEVEIDDTSICSGSDDAGDYVLAWVWVSDPESEEDNEN